MCVCLFCYPNYVLSTVLVGVVLYTSQAVCRVSVAGLVVVGTTCGREGSVRHRGLAEKGAC